MVELGGPCQMAGGQLAIQQQRLLSLDTTRQNEVALSLFTLHTESSRIDALTGSHMSWKTTFLLMQNTWKIC
ncbi:hypothetical protein MHYP_G00051360 [Metynnis hypsauchen]